MASFIAATGLDLSVHSAGAAAAGAVAGRVVGAVVGSGSAARLTAVQLTATPAATIIAIAAGRIASPIYCICCATALAEPQQRARQQAPAAMSADTQSEYGVKGSRAATATGSPEHLVQRDARRGRVVELRRRRGSLAHDRLVGVVEDRLDQAGVIEPAPPERSGDPVALPPNDPEDPGANAVEVGVGRRG
ncbi:MAG TPA: hypothetical protein VF796_30445 [Humisphaera sp.]